MQDKGQPAREMPASPNESAAASGPNDLTYAGGTLITLICAAAIAES